MLEPDISDSSLIRRRDPSTDIGARRRQILKRLDKTYGRGTSDEYIQLLKEQLGRCAICNDDYSESPKLLHLDHDHKTNKVRGLLCGTCNSLLGMAKDDPLILTAAMVYLWERR